MTLLMDKIFKALTDPTRRAILDRLREKDGQSLSELEEGVQMTRFGVMKHLRVLEEAGLIVTVKKGRFKFHYLNALPLQEAIDRWIEPLLSKPAARAVIGLKAKLEGGTAMPETTKPDFVMQTYIRCTQDALWDALHSAEVVAEFHFLATSAAMKGDVMESYAPDGSILLRERVTEEDPKSRMVTGFTPGWLPDAPESKVIYLIDAEPGHCKLTIEHYGLTPGLEGVADGWHRWAGGLKTWLETGQEVHFAMPMGEDH